jgi:hypothetical protein
MKHTQSFGEEWVNAMYSLTLEKLTITELDKAFPPFMEPDFPYCVHKSLPLLPVKSQMNSVHILTH